MNEETYRVNVWKWSAENSFTPFREERERRNYDMKLVVVKFTLVLARKTGKTDESKNSEKWNEGKSVEKLRKRKQWKTGSARLIPTRERKKYKINETRESRQISLLVD